MELLLEKAGYMGWRRLGFSLEILFWGFFEIPPVGSSLIFFGALSSLRDISSPQSANFLSVCCRCGCWIGPSNLEDSFPILLMSEVLLAPPDWYFGIINLELSEKSWRLFGFLCRRREGGRRRGGEVREVLLALQPSQGNVNRKTVSSSFTWIASVVYYFIFIHFVFFSFWLGGGGGGEGEGFESDFSSAFDM